MANETKIANAVSLSGKTSNNIDFAHGVSGKLADFTDSNIGKIRDRDTAFNAITNDTAGITVAQAKTLDMIKPE